MITLKYIPNILSNDGRIEKQLQYEPYKTISDYLDEAGVPSGSMRAIVNGHAIRDFNRGVHRNDEVIITPDVAFDPGSWALIVMAFQAFSIIATVVGVGYAIYQAITYRRPSTPSYNTNAQSSPGMDSSSPTYGWEGITTTQEVGIPIPIIYGEHAVGGQIINSFVSTDGEKNYLNALIALGEGEIDDITDIKINENPAENFESVEVTERLGTNDQTVIPNFQDLHDNRNVNVQLVQSSAYTYTTVNDDCEGFDLYMRLPSGLFYIGTDGSVNNWSVTYQVEYKLHADASYTDLGSTTISYKSRSTVRRIFTKRGLTAGQYDIRVTRTSADSDLSGHTGDLYLYSVDEIRTDDLAYPNTALVGIKALAQEQLSGGMPNWIFTVRGKKIYAPTIMNGGAEVVWEDYYWDPDTNQYKLIADDTVLAWDGESYSMAWCANPAWCLADLIFTTRYGLGQFINVSQIDLPSIIAAGRYFDELVEDGQGGWEKRMRLDVVLDSSARAPDILMQLCSAFRGILFYSEGTIRLKVDKPEDPVQIFGMGNILDAGMAQQWKSKKDQFNVIDVQFLDKDKSYEQEQVSYIDETSLAAGEPMRRKSIRVFCTRISQAIREARYALNTSKRINRSISLKVGADAVVLNAGDIFGVSHDVPQIGFSGRVGTGSTTTNVVLDRSVTLAAGKTYKIRVRFADDTMEERGITDGPGTYTAVNCVAFTNAPASYDVYAVGQENILIKKYRAMGLQKDAENNVVIQGVEYDPLIYDDSAVDLPQTNYSELSLEIPNVSNLALTERLVKLSDGTIEDAIDVWFDKTYDPTYVRTIKTVRIYISEDNVNWKYAGETTGTHFQIIGDIADGVKYYIAAVTVAEDNEEAALADSPKSDITIIGKSAPPADVTTFLVNQSRDRLFFGWTAVTDVDLSGYEIRIGESWATGYTLVSNYKGTSYIDLNIKEGADQSFFIKAMDTSGNFSENATEATVTIADVPFKNIIESYSEQTAWSGTKSNTETDGDNLIISTGEVSGTYVTPVRDLGYVATFKIGIEAVTIDATTNDATFSDDANVEWDDSLTRRFSGDEVLGSVTFEIKTSEDNSTWSDWKTWQQGDYTCRYFQIRMTLARANTSLDIQCVSMDYYADLPDVDEFDTGSVTDAGTGLAVTFSKTFHEEPVVNINVTSGTGIYYKTTSKSTTGMTVKLYQADGTSVTGDFEYHCHGV